jgi:diaminohydroxyphosphoribosylaminopyrimidine deaminase / 5-amino-6-(5-phosphoribosylamino)uracil reductase
MSASSVTLKLATSLDGRIATAAGESQWITGPLAREQVHRLRAEHDAVLVGIETALADDPELTVRLAGYSGAQPSRIVLDSHQRLVGKLVASALKVPTYVVSCTPPEARLTEAGVRVLQVANADGHPSLPAALSALRGVGLSRLFVEGGGQVAASFLRAGLVDRLEWFRAPILLGAEGKPALGQLCLNKLSDAPGFRRLDVRQVGDDLWERYERI